MNETTQEIVKDNLKRLGALEANLISYREQSKEDLANHKEQAKADLKRLESMVDDANKRTDLLREEIHGLRMFILKVAAAIVVIIAGADGAVKLSSMVGM